MDINVMAKLRSLHRRGDTFYCLAYDWDRKQIYVI